MYNWASDILEEMPVDICFGDISLFAASKKICFFEISYLSMSLQIKKALIEEGLRDRGLGWELSLILVGSQGFFLEYTCNIGAVGY